MSSVEVFSSQCNQASLLTLTEYLFTPSFDLFNVFLFIFDIFSVNLNEEPQNNS